MPLRLNTAQADFEPAFRALLDAKRDSAPDVANMYENLLRASGFHLNAFERQL